MIFQFLVSHIHLLIRTKHNVHLRTAGEWPDDDARRNIKGLKSSLQFTAAYNISQSRCQGHQQKLTHYKFIVWSVLPCTIPRLRLKMGWAILRITQGRPSQRANKAAVTPHFPLQVIFYREWRETYNTPGCEVIRFLSSSLRLNFVAAPRCSARLREGGREWPFIQEIQTVHIPVYTTARWHDALDREGGMLLVSARTITEVNGRQGVWLWVI